MWRVGSRAAQATDLWVGTRSVAWALPGAQFERVATAGNQDMQARLLDGLGPNPRRLLRIWLSGALCQPFLMPEVAGLRDPDELQVAARAVAAEATTLGDECQVWVDPAPPPLSRGMRLAAALPAGCVTGLANGLAQVGRAVSVRPWWSEVLRWSMSSAPSRPQLLGIDDGESLTVLSGTEGSFDGATSQALPRDRAGSQSAWSRALLASDKPAAAALLFTLTGTGADAMPGDGLAFGRWTTMVAP